MMLQNILRRQLITMAFQQRPNGLMDICPIEDSNNSFTRGTYHRSSLPRMTKSVCSKCGCESTYVLDLKKQIENLEEKIKILRGQLSAMQEEQYSQQIELKNLSIQMNSKIDGCADVVKTLMGPPPPPPPPPPPTPVTTRTSIIDIIKKNRKTQRSQSCTNADSVIDMSEVLKGMKNVKLKQVARSPGGTPLRTKPECQDQDTGSFLARALKRKFASIADALNRSPNSSKSPEWMSPQRKKDFIPGPHLLRSSRTNTQRKSLTTSSSLTLVVE